uniref:Secreted protein n=1 Tax=Rhipicephalus microplus TaxID=6941 RepID=A0A6G5AG50_RHIMP
MSPLDSFTIYCCRWLFWTCLPHMASSDTFTLGDSLRLLYFIQSNTVYVVLHTVFSLMCFFNSRPGSLCFTFVCLIQLFAQNWIIRPRNRIMTNALRNISFILLLLAPTALKQLTICTLRAFCGDNISASRGRCAR